MEHSENSALTLLETSIQVLALAGCMVGKRYRHKKTGKIVTVKGVAIGEKDMTINVIYNEGMMTWVRPAIEFIDGRFEEVTD